MPWGSLLVSKVACLFNCPCFSYVFVLGAGAFSPKVIGRWWFLPSLSFLVRTCVSPSRLVYSFDFVLAVLWSLWDWSWVFPPLCPLLSRLCWLYCGFLGSELLFLECVCLPSLCSPRSPLLAVLWFSWLWVGFTWVCVSSFSLFPSVTLCWLHCCFPRKVWGSAAHVCMLFFFWFVNSLLCCIY